MRTPALAFLLTLVIAGGCGALVTPEAPPDHPEARYRQAARLRGQALAAIDGGNWAAAVTILSELQDVLPDNLLPPLNLAVCHQQLGNQTQALEAIHRAQELAPANPRVLFALASIFREAEDTPGWASALATYADLHPGDPRPHYLGTRWLLEDGEPDAAFAAAERAVDAEPENLVLLVERLVAAASAGRFDASSDSLDAIEDRLDGFEGPAADYAEQLRAAVASESASALAPTAQVLRNILRPSGLYRQHLIPLTGSDTSGRGIFVQLDFEPALPKSIQGGQDIAFELVAPTPAPALDVPGLRHELILSSRTDRDSALASGEAGVVGLGRTAQGWESDELLALAPGMRLWGHLDIDNEGSPDWLVERDRALWVSSEAQAPQRLFVFDHELDRVEPVDVDHDGDLDLVVATSVTTHYLQNNGDGSWRRDDSLLAALGGQPISDLLSADFDDDGDLDLVTVAGSRLRLLSNARLGPLDDVSRDWQLEGLDVAGAHLLTDDFDADGLFDLLVWSPDEARLLRNAGDHFLPAALPHGTDRDWRAVEAADLDNDGDRDLLVALADGAVLLLRNHRSQFVAEAMAPRLEGAAQLLAGDFDGDGDLDVLARGAAGIVHWRNDGASLNHWLRIRLRGRSENNSKNNSQGRFVRIESRTAQGFQALLGNGGVNHLGLGSHRQVDALRVVWTNGLSQTWAALAADQTLEEEQVLKGSCPFLYTWNGERFEFVTDLMWKSPLGMTLADGTPAPHQSAADFVLVPGERLQPAGGALWLQVTEELWETVYVDRQKLLAVDHPNRAELVVDEKFTLPPHPTEPPLHWIDRRLRPVAATDERGRDVLEEILDRDGRHVGGLPLSRYQGVTTGHALELRFADVPADGRLRLVLHGWIFPTDTSINFALAQDRFPAPAPPRLELATDSGWTTLSPSIGFPSGKRKAVVVELTGLLPAGDVRLRLATDMQIYWDSASLAVGEPELEPRITTLEAAASDLHYRGFSRLYRSTATSPHLFDYSTVTTEPRFRDLGGRYTRFGPVTELLGAADDRYVVMNAGDELTIRYPTAGLPPLPTGWRRDYVLFTDGWVKDGDIHTARSQTVEPWPFHAMDAYPASRRVLADPIGHRRWLDEYQTRWVDDTPFRLGRRPSGAPTLP